MSKNFNKALRGTGATIRKAGKGGRQIRVVMRKAWGGPLTYSISRRAATGDMGQHIQSKLPVTMIQGTTATR